MRKRAARRRGAACLGSRTGDAGIEPTLPLALKSR
jgi:hypothetical protein